MYLWIDPCFKVRTRGKRAKDNEVFRLLHDPHLLTELLLNHAAIDTVPECVASELGLVKRIPDMGRDDGGGDDLGMRVFEGSPRSLSIVSEDPEDIIRDLSEAFSSTK